MTRGAPDRTAPSLLVSDEGPVRTITLNRPHVRNALDGVTLTALHDELDWAASVPAVRVIVLRGAGGSFCSGEDLDEAATLTDDEFVSRIATFQAITRIIRQAPKPVVASVAGAASGGGFELTLACDLRIACTSATFTCPEAYWGLAVSNGASVLLAGLVGSGRAREITLLGRPLDAVTAARYGLVSELAEPTSLEERTRQVTARLLEASPTSLRLTKEVLALSDNQLEMALDAEAEALVEAFATPEAREGLRAFAERRPVSFDV